MLYSPPLRHERDTAMTDKHHESTLPGTVLPSVERIQHELASAKTVDDFFGKAGIFARLFAGTLEQMLEAELTAHLGYEPYAASGRNSGNSRNGKRSRNVRTSAGDMTIQVPRDRNGDFQPALLDKYQTSTNELEDKIIALYAKGVSTRDIQETLHELYGVEVSAATISTVTDKVWTLVEAWQSRPLATVYPIVYLDALHLKLRRDSQVRNTAVYIVFGADLKRIYQAPTREAAELQLLELGERWGDQYAVAVRSWEKNRDDLATMFDYAAETRRLIYTTNTVEGYNRQVRKVVKTKGALLSGEAARKLLYLATRDITKTWTAPIYNWAKIRNQLAIRFEGRFPE